MTNTQVHEALIMWLSSLFNVTVIKDRQGIKRPTIPYMMVDLANFGEVRQWPSYPKFVDLGTLNSEGLAEVEATPIMEMEWVFLVFYYGAGGDEVLSRLKSARHLPQIQETLMPSMTIHEVGRVNSVPEFVDERWEPRAQVNVVLRGLSSDGFVVDVIEEHEPFDIRSE